MGGASFTSNYILAYEAGYFDRASDFKPLLHLWSLAIVEQFYIFFPLITIFLTNKIKFPKIFILLLSIFTISAYLCWSKNYNFSIGFYYSQYRIWELISGSMLAFSCYKVKLTKPILRYKFIIFNENFISLLGLAILIYGVFYIDEHKIYPGILSIIPVVGALFIISTPRAWFSQLLGHNFLVSIGLISYPLYLWHWTLLSFWRIINGDPSILVKSLIIFFSILISYLSFKYIEKPIRNAKF